MSPPSSSIVPTPVGLILLAHGARDPAWSAPFEAVAERLAAAQPGHLIRLAFLELMAPSMAEAGDALVQAGCHEVRVLPLFLGAGGHVRKDLPAQMTALAARHGSVQWALMPAAGPSDELIQALATWGARMAGEPLAAAALAVPPSPIGQQT